MQTKKFAPELDAHFILVDFKACVMHALTAGTDENCRYDSVTGREVNTAEFGFRTFLDMYVAYWLDDMDAAPWQIIVAHEGGHVFRSMISPDYKDNRKLKEGEEPKSGPELGEEYDRLEKLIKAFLAYIGCTQGHVAGVEGDDLVTYFNNALSPNYPCSVYTVDADMLALIGENTTVHIKKQLVFNAYDSLSECLGTVTKNMHEYLRGLCDEEENFYEEIKDDVFRFIPLYKSIVGDTADGYAGVKGLGVAKWYQAVKDYGIDGLEELQTIVENRDWITLKECADADLSDKLMAKLYTARSEWRQSWVLAQLHPELCWKPTKSKLTKVNWYKRIPNEANVRAILAKCSCEDFYDEFLADLMPQKWLIDANNYEGDEVADFTALCKESFVVGWDYETSAKNLPKGDINIVGSRVNGVSFCAGKNFQYAFYITTDHKDSANLPQSVISEFILGIPSSTPTVAHNLQFETIVTATNYGIVIDGGYDTAIMNSYVNENNEAGLKKCSKRELNYDQETYAEVLHKAGRNVLVKDECKIKDSDGNEQVIAAEYDWVPAENMREVTAEQVMSYGIDDSIVACHLFCLYWLRMQLENSWDFYAKHEPTFTKRTSLSQIKGVNLDFHGLTKLHNEDISTIKENKDRLRVILQKHCASEINTPAVKAYLDSDADYIKAKVKVSLEKLKVDDLIKKVIAGINWLNNAMELSDEGEKILAALSINVTEGKKAEGFSATGARRALVSFELYKLAVRACTGSVYVPYTVTTEQHQTSPTVKNLAEVCKVLDLKPIESVGVSKLSEWEQEVCNIDFDEDTDDTHLLDEKQKTLVDLLNAAKKTFKMKAADKAELPEYTSLCCFLSECLGKKAVETWSGTELSTASPIQMQHLIYCMLGLPVRLRSKLQKGSNRQKLGFLGSCGTDALAVDTALAEDLSGEDYIEWKVEALNCLKRIKQSETRISLYHTPYPLLVEPDTGIMHPSIRSCGTVTRRPTGGAPNILQVSKHQKKGVMRSVFLPIEDDHIIIAIDFAGQELRMLASVTKDRNLLSAYLGESLADKYLEDVSNGILWDIKTVDIADLADVKDLHSNTGSGIIQIFGLDDNNELVAGGSPVIKSAKMEYTEFHKALTDKTHEFHVLANKVRKKPAKTSNFLMAYGGSHIALSQKLIIKEEQGKDIVGAMMKLYPNIEKEQALTLKFAKENGFAETAYGNRRHATDELFSKRAGEVNRLGRQLFNARIQGTAAEVLKVVMLEAETTEGGPIWDRLNAVMMAPVYDEIVASVPVKHAWQYIKEMTPIMNLLPPNHAVPMMADVSLGPDWQKQNELGSFPTQDEVEEAAEEAFLQVLNARAARKLEGHK